ncbi:MAG: RluA family pseudouridine synthase [Deltaproteobacteria bacterium]|nr:RluA family pseudouridine synthase [Deltaproteobacteria bacterium]
MKRHGQGEEQPPREEYKRESREETARDFAREVRIVHLERSFVVVEKPAGLSTVLHPEDRERLPKPQWPPTLERLLPPLIKRREGARAPKGPARPVRVVQRLDIGTSGLLVFARTPAAERALGQQFRQHTVHRRYLALVRGNLERPRRLESLLVDDRGDGLRGSHPSRGKRAVTHAAPLEALSGGTLVECRLETGRTHQIRIHLAEAGFPLWGETLYHRPFHGQPFHGHLLHSPVQPDDAPRVMLHAGELGFNHPETGKPMRFAVEPPEDFMLFLEKKRKQTPPSR